MDHNPACTICNRDLWNDEQGRLICRLCQQHVDRNLQSIAGPRGLYARLCLRTTPGKSSGGPAVSGTRGSSMPPSEHVLNLVANGGIVSNLESWVKDWATYGLADIGEGGRLQHRIDHAVRTLRLNLGQAALKHPALDEFAREIHSMVRQCSAVVEGEKPPIRVRVQCPCGATLGVTLSTDGETCRACGAEYGHTEVLRLPLADRRAAA
ncbi:TFIIB-type zinc finger domain-containing protein [Streptomyces filamentosus]|uniref:Uncharacterized protein n=1 Tax=Streptomyces filamentosus TaxID=67294 RepID=A0A919BTI8_STRFL|nr:TFIIB-type zinc finger domain-containing protein [Streptomyces filamentosus]GHG15277.1 hypothetical protein GCM10017667_56000 [Streptomyces filamentosus]